RPARRGAGARGRRAGGGEVAIATADDRTGAADDRSSSVRPPASTVYVAPATDISASAGRAGAGGRVAVWSTGRAEVSGRLWARGGAAGGDGGSIAVSAAAELGYTGEADAGAPAGRAGVLSLDPTNLAIDAGTGTFPQFDLVRPATNAGDQFGSTRLVLAGG